MIDFFDPVLAMYNQDYFDFNTFDYDNPMEPEFIDPLLFHSGFDERLD